MMKTNDPIRRGRVSLVIICLLWFSALASHAVTTNYYVATNGPGGNFLSWEQAASNIQQAIDATADGDVVNVSNGLYSVGGVTNYPAGALLTNRVAIWKAITVQSFNNDPTNTIIKGAWASSGQTNGDDAVRCMYMAANSTLIGFTLTNGATMTIAGNNNNYAGALYAPGGVNTTVSNCIFTGNAGRYYCVYGENNPNTTYKNRFLNCIFKHNDMRSGVSGCTRVIRYGCLSNCIVANNITAGAVANSEFYNGSIVSNGNMSEDGQGTGADTCFVYNSIIGWNNAYLCGGVYNGGILNNCLIIGNSGRNGGVLGYPTMVVVLSNCTVVANSTAGYNAYEGRAGGVGGNVICINCIVWGNTNGSGTAISNIDWSGTVTFINSCTTTNPAYPGVTAGYITNNPLFVNQGSGIGATYALGNLRLQNSSPCVNTGTNAPGVGNWPDLDGLTRIRYGTVDMGCYERINSGTIFGLR